MIIPVLIGVGILVFLLASSKGKSEEEKLAAAIKLIPQIQEPQEPKMQVMTEEQVIDLFGKTHEEYMQQIKNALGGVGPAVGSHYKIDDSEKVIKGYIEPMPGHLRPADAAPLIKFSNRVQELFKLRYAKVIPFIKGKESPAYAVAYQGPWVQFFVWIGDHFELTYVNRFGLGPPGAGGGFDPLALISTVAGYTLPMIPGIGTAANVALQTTIAIGQGKSLDEAALIGIRATLPPWAQVAFDLGVGIVLEGKDPDDAAIDAALAQLNQQYPGAAAAYEQGRRAMQDLGGPSLPSSKKSQLDRIYSR